MTYIDTGVRVAGPWVLCSDLLPLVQVGGVWLVEQELARVEGLQVTLLGRWVQPSKDVHLVAIHAAGVCVPLLGRNLTQGSWIGCLPGLSEAVEGRCVLHLSLSL